MTTDSGTHGVRGLCSNRGSSRFGLLVVCLAAILVGAFAQAGHAQSVTLGGGTMRVFGTGGDDVIFFITFDIAAGSLFPGQDGEEGPPVIPALAPLPESDITVLFTVINGLIFPPAPAGFAPPATQAQWDALKAEVEGLPTKDDIKLIIVRADDGDDVVDCSELAGDMAIETELYGEAGNDRLLGGEKNDIIDGGSGDDVLMGGKGDDEILGGAGNDILRGFEGADTLNGGGGFDLLDYALDGGARAINVNLPAGTATDGWGGADKVEGFSAIRGRGTNDTLVGNANDSTTILGGAGNDTITGGTDRDVLFGEDGNDVIRGGNEEGAGDFIFGGAGNDELFGGEGQDTINGDGNPPPAWDTGVFVAVGDPLEPLTALTVDTIVGVAPTIPDGSGNDKIYGGMDADLIYGGGGSDIIWGDNQDDPATRQHGDTIYGDYGDPTSLQGGGDQIHGGGGSDRIYGGAGGDTIYGDGGADTIQGNAGSDSIYGGQLILPSGGYIDDNMADTVDYSDAPKGVWVTLPSMGVSSTASQDGYDGIDTLDGIEHLRGSEFDDYLIGSDILTVGNIIEGLGGNDVILGGRGDDFLYGGEGDDYIWGDGGDQYQGGNDTIYGGPGNNELHGEGGDDIFVLGGGNDTAYGGAGRDTLNYSGAPGSGGVGIIADFTASPVMINHFALVGFPPVVVPAVDTIYNCDNLGPPAAPTVGPGVPLPYINCAAAENTFISRVEVIQGSSFADTITGYASLSMEIRGGAGNDTLTGGSANDLIYGEAGDDLIEGLGGDDYLDGGANSTVGDTVTYAHAPAGVKVTLGLSSAQNTVSAGFDILAGFENLTGSAFNDTLTGDANPNTIRGLAGDDVLNGRGDKDVVVGGITLLSQDTLDGGPGTDIADYRQGTPPLNPPPNPAGGVALDDGEGGSDILVSIEGVYLPAGALFVSAGADKAIKPGGSTVLDGIATGGYGNYSYVWDTVPPITPDPGKLQDDCSLTVPGLNTRCIAKPTATPAATTVYRLTVTDAPPGGGQALVSSAFVQVVVASALTVSAGPDATISLGQTAQLTGAISGGVAPYTVLWSPSAGVSKIDALLTTASPNATTLYTLTVTDQVGQQASDTMTVTVLNPFTVDAGADVSITQGQSTLLNATVVGGTPPFVYQWSPPDGLLSTTIPNPECRAFVTTTYVVTVTDSTGRVVVDSVKVTVLPAGGSSGDGGQGNGSQTGDGSGTGNGGTGGTGGTGTTDTPTVRPIFPCGFGVSQSLVFGCLLFLGLACGRRVRSWSR